MKIVISPFCNSFNLPDTELSTKNLSAEWWKTVIKKLKLHHEIIQIGENNDPVLTHDYRFDLKIDQLEYLIEKEMDLFISADNSFSRMCSNYDKHGIVMFSQSPPKTFEYSKNINLLKEKECLRYNNEQFLYWDDYEYKEDPFIYPEEVIKAVNEFNLVTSK